MVRDSHDVTPPLIRVFYAYYKDSNLPLRVHLFDLIFDTRLCVKGWRPLTPTTCSKTAPGSASTKDSCKMEAQPSFAKKLENWSWKIGAPNQWCFTGNWVSIWHYNKASVWNISLIYLNIYKHKCCIFIYIYIYKNLNTWCIDIIIIYYMSCICMTDRHRM